MGESSGRSSAVPNAVVLESSDATKRNLSGVAWAAFQETGTTVPVSLFSGSLKFLFRGSLKTVERMNEDTPGTGRGSIVVLEPHPRPRRRRPTNVTDKENLNKAEVETMLAVRAGWKLAVPNGSSTDVLTKDRLREAWARDASGTVTLPLRGTDTDEQVVLDDAKERLSPKGGAARVTAAMGAPLTQVAVLGTAFGAFVGWKGDEVARPWLLYLGAFTALVAVILSVIGTNALRTSTVNLSRIDLLQQRSGSFGPPIWLTNLAIALFVLALIALFLSAFPGKSSGNPSASFGEVTTSKVGARTHVSFTVKWDDLGSDAASVRTTVSGGRTPKTVVTPRGKDGKVSQAVSVTVQAPTTLTVSTQALDKRNQPVGNKVVHTYKVS